MPEALMTIPRITIWMRFTLYKDDLLQLVYTSWSQRFMGKAMHSL